jgi:hypothetical protein
MSFSLINDWADLGTELGWGITFFSISYMHFPTIKDLPLNGFSLIVCGLGFRISRGK